MILWYEDEPIHKNENKNKLCNAVEQQQQKKKNKTK